MSRNPQNKRPGETASSGEITQEAPTVHSSSFQFPTGFLWGAATSSHQVEGDNRANDWWAFEEAGCVPEPSGRAADHYHRFREDFDLARDLHHNAHRFSLEWSRIEPEEGEFSDQALSHYGEVLDALRERNLEPIVTLYHFTLPRWVAERGGWANPEIEKWFARYADHVHRAFHDKVRWWVTINEPLVMTFKGYLDGDWPPGHKDEFPTALRVVRHLLRAHVLAYHRIHERQPQARVSVAKNAISFAPCNPNKPMDRISVAVRGYLYNRFFLDALHKGVLRVPGLFWERLPSGRTLDFIGLNYYTRDFVGNTGFQLPGLIGQACSLDVHRHVGKRTDLGWEVYPEGLGEFLRSYSRYGLPILITENGIATETPRDRWTFITLHLWQVIRALDQGIPVAGYLHWSLLDNFEWAEGYRARFGLIGVDYRTQTRTVRESARWLGEVMRNNQL